MNLRNQNNRFPMIFPMVTAIFLSLAQIGCDNSGEANIVTRRGKAGQGGIEKPTKETGIVPASHAAMALTSVRQVLRLVDIALYQENSVHFDKKCQSLKSVAVDDSTTQLTLSTNKRGCMQNWSGDEDILVTKKNNVISKIEKLRGRGITLEILARGKSDVEIEVSDSFTLDRLEGLEYRVKNYDGLFTVTEEQGARDDNNRNRPARSFVSESQVAFAGKIDLTDAQNPTVEIESLLNRWELSYNRAKTMFITSVLSSANESSAAPVSCLWPLGFYNVQQESDKHLGQVFSPVVTVTKDNRILAPNARNNFEGRACQNGLLGLQETLFIASHLTHLSSRESAVAGAAGGSTYGKRSGRPDNNDSGKNDESKKDKNNKKNKKNTSENDNA